MSEDLVIPHYCIDLIQKVREVSGKPLVCRVEYSRFDSELRVARNADKFHELLCSPDYRHFIVHFLVSALKKIIRVLEAPKNMRYVPAVNSGGDLPIAEKAEFERRTPALSKGERDLFSRLMFDGIARQLTSMPIDLRVEREIKQTLPEHRPLQREYLERQVADLIPHFDSAVRAFTPERVYNASSYMHAALMLEAAEIARVGVPEVLKDTEIEARGRDLLSILRSIEEPGLPGDRKAANAWAQQLGLEAWYDWTPLE